MSKISIYMQGLMLTLVTIIAANNFCSEYQRDLSNLYDRDSYSNLDRFYNQNASSIEPYQTNPDDGRWQVQTKAFFESEINNYRGITPTGYKEILEKTYTDMRLTKFGQCLLFATPYLTFLVGLATAAGSSYCLPQVLGDQNSKVSALIPAIMGCAGCSIANAVSRRLFFDKYNEKYLKQMIVNSQLKQLENSSSKLSALQN